MSNHSWLRGALVAMAALVLAPAPTRTAEVPQVADTFTRTALPAQNFGTVTYLQIDGTSRALLRFDLSTLPPGTAAEDVSKATLKLFVNKVLTAGSFDVAPVLTPWAEHTVTAANGPSIGGPIGPSTPVTTANQFVVVDVTQLVRDWLSGLANEGFALVAAPGTSVLFDSKENVATSHPAALDVALSQTGPQGPQGPQGTQGPIGPQGPAGPAGSGGGGSVTLAALQNTPCAVNGAIGIIRVNVAANGDVAIRCEVTLPDPDPDPDPDPEPMPQTGTVRFAVLGNQGSGSSDQAAVAQALANTCASLGCDFVQLLGTNMRDAGVSSVTDDQWNSKFEVPYAAVSAPFFAVLGVQDYGEVGIDANRAAIQVAYTQVSSKWKMPARYYRRTVAHTEFVGLDTPPLLLATQPQQQATSSGWLASSTARWKIAFGNQPYRSNGAHGNAGNYSGVPFPPVNGSLVKAFLENAVCGKADVYFSAWDRSLQWLTEPCAGTELIVSGTGSNGTELPGSNPVRFQSLESGFVYVTIQDGVLEMRFYNKDGAVLFTRAITKTPTPDPPGAILVEDFQFINPADESSQVTIAPTGTVTFSYPEGGSVHNVSFLVAQPTQCTQTAGTNFGAVPPLPAFPSPQGWAGTCRFDTPGTYVAICQAHPSEVAEIIVR